jgi:putative methionine-R-sulfoxide reductase with GAF domain
VNAVLRPLTAESETEKAFFDSQMLPPEKRGVTFEVLFYRQLQQVSTRIHETENIDQIMLEASQDICRLLNADRLTLYAVNEDRSAIVSKIKTGLNTSRDLKLPISGQSIAGFVAQSRQMLNVADVYDDDALKRIHPSLTFLKEVDKRSGYRTKQMLVVPILSGDELHGVLQVINNKSDHPFGDLEVEGASQLCKTLATAIKQRLQKADESVRRKATKYDGLVSEGVLTPDDLHQCVQTAREEAKSVEHVLMARYQIRPAQIGPSIAKFFGVPYEPFNAGRIRSEMLHGPLKRDFLVEQGWVPLEESPEGLVVMCIDPEAVRGSRIVPQVFPRISKFAYRVTTQTEFEETLSQLYGAGAEGGSIDELLADLNAPMDDDGSDDSRWSRQLQTTNWSSSSTRSSSMPTTRRHPTSTLSRCRASSRPASGCVLTAAWCPTLKCRPTFGRPWSPGSRSCVTWTSRRSRKPQDGKIKFKKYGPLDIELRVATIPSPVVLKTWSCVSWPLVSQSRLKNWASHRTTVSVSRRPSANRMACFMCAARLGLARPPRCTRS